MGSRWIIRACLLKTALEDNLDGMDALNSATVTGMFLSSKKQSSTKSRLNFKQYVRSILWFGLTIFYISERLGNL